MDVLFTRAGARPRAIAKEFKIRVATVWQSTYAGGELYYCYMIHKPQLTAVLLSAL